MKIGLISDTHGYLPDSLFEHFKDCDEIWHAGDIGNISLADELSKFKSLKAVYGNIDGIDIRAQYPEDLRFNCQGWDILITHIAGAPPKYNKRIKALLNEKPPQILVCGHSHLLRIEKDPKHNNMLYLNPGAAGIHGFHKNLTLIRFELEKTKINNMQVIDLGKRGLGPHHGS